MNSTNRVVQLTWSKCGSQWVRDVLTAPELFPFSQTSWQGEGLADHLSQWPQQADRTFWGPIFGASYENWVRHRREGDKAVVVLRDPRDRIVSLAYSLTYSHRSNPFLDAAREISLCLTPSRRLMLAIVLDGGLFAPSLLSWGGKKSTASEYVTSYEKLVNDSYGEYARIMAFLGWDVPDHVLRTVVDRLSFERRSGRRPGNENIYSHYRMGKPGDWRRHFDARLARLLEALLPNLVVALGYETSSDWYKDLPESLDDDHAASRVLETKSIVDLRAEMIRLREENLALRDGMQAQQQRLTALERRRSA
jgi:hypothetical protein